MSRLKSQIFNEKCIAVLGKRYVGAAPCVDDTLPPLLVRILCVAQQTLC